MFIIDAADLLGGSDTAFCKGFGIAFIGPGG